MGMTLHSIRCSAADHPADCPATNVIFAFPTPIGDDRAQRIT
jgi:hypothetical protein